MNLDKLLYINRLETNSNPLFQMADVPGKEKMEDRADSPDQSYIPATPEADDETLKYIRSLSQDGNQPSVTPDDDVERQDLSHIDDISPATPATPASKKKEKKDIESQIADELTEELNRLRTKYMKALRDGEEVRKKREHADREYERVWNYSTRQKKKIEDIEGEIDQLKKTNEEEKARLEDEIKNLNVLILGLEKEKEDYKKNLREAHKDHSKFRTAQEEIEKKLSTELETMKQKEAQKIKDC